MGLVTQAFAGLPGDVENRICTFIVGKLEGALNSDACDWIVGEATGIAAGMLAETGPAEIIEDPIIAYVAHRICDDAVSAIENHFHVGPEGICIDLGYGGRRRRQLGTSAAGSTASGVVHKTATFANYAEAAAAWTSNTTARWNQIRHTHMAAAGMPVAYFPHATEGKTVGYCFEGETGFYHCMEPGYADRFALNSSAGQALATMEMQAITATSSSSSTTSPVATAAIVILTVALVGCVGYVAVLHARLKRVGRDQSLLLDDTDSTYAAATDQ